jgi:hypothetical protein
MRPDDDSFNITYPKGELRFVHRTDGLYVHDTSKDRTCLITTVAESEARYTICEVNQAREAHQLQRRLANPPDAKLIKALTTGSIQNTTVTTADVARALKGPSIEALKGRITATRALPFPEETMTRTTAEQKMYADIFFAAGNAFEITICSHIERTDAPSLRRALRTHLGTYEQRRIIIHHIYNDNEKGILCMDQDFAGAGITLHLAGPGMNIPAKHITIQHNYYANLRSKLDLGPVLPPIQSNIYRWGFLYMMELS